MRDTLKRGADHRREGPEGDGRAKRMHAEQAAPREAAGAPGGRGRRARGARALRRRRGHLHRRPRLHPPVGLPVADDQAQPRPAAHRSGGHVLDSCVGCGLCGEVAHAAVLCPSFYRAEIVSNPTRWDARCAQRLRARACIGWLQRARRAPARARYACLSCSAMTPRRRSRSRSRSSRWAARAAACWPTGSSTSAEHNGYIAQATSVPGVAQRTGATIYYVELFPQAAAERDGARAGAGADAAAGRRRRGARLRADGGRPRGAARPGHARPHHADRLDPPRLRDRREDRAGRRPRRRRQRCSRTPQRRGAALRALRHGAGGRATPAA